MQSVCRHGVVGPQIPGGLPHLGPAPHFDPSLRRHLSSVSARNGCCSQVLQRGHAPAHARTITSPAAMRWQGHYVSPNAHEFTCVSAIDSVRKERLAPTRSSSSPRFGVRSRFRPDASRWCRHLLQPFGVEHDAGAPRVCGGWTPRSFETTRSFGRSSPPIRLSNPESP